MGRRQSLAQEYLAAAGAAVEVDAQEGLQPLGGGLGRFLPWLWRRANAQQTTNVCQALFLAAIGEQPIVPDAHEAIG